jgi:hypothetical protein
VQVIAAIEGGQQLVGMIGIAYHCIEIDYAVEMVGGADPFDSPPDDSPEKT